MTCLVGLRYTIYEPWHKVALIIYNQIRLSTTYTFLKYNTKCANKIGNQLHTTS